jgi:hypothetical protein
MIVRRRMSSQSFGPKIAAIQQRLISFKNIGYAAATHLRLTMSYPGAEILSTIVDHEDENMTVKNEREGTSVVAFLPRLTPGSSIAIENNITRSYHTNPANEHRGSLVDYNADTRWHACQACEIIHVN